jgi:hypothetical protein
MPQSKLNWLDKTLWALAELAAGETYYNVYVMKVMLAGSLLLGLLMTYRLLWKVIGIVSFDPPETWWFMIPLYALCYIPIHLTTHSATQIETANLQCSKRWTYTGLGLFIFPISWVIYGLFLVWLETWSKW